MSLPLPLPHQEQKKGLFKHPPFPFFFSLRSLRSANWYLLSACTSGARDPGERDSPGAGAREWVLRLALCPPITQLMASQMWDRLLVGSSFRPNFSPSRIRYAKHLGGREERGRREEPSRLCWVTQQEHSKNHLDCWVTLKAVPCSRVSWGVDVPTEWDHQLASSPNCHWRCVTRVWRSDKNVKSKSNPKGDQKKRGPLFGGWCWREGINSSSVNLICCDSPWWYGHSAAKTNASLYFDSPPAPC